MNTRVKFLLGEWEEAHHHHGQILCEIDRLANNHPAMAYLVAGLQDYTIEKYKYIQELSRYGIDDENKALIAFDRMQQERGH